VLTLTRQLSTIVALLGWQEEAAVLADIELQRKEDLEDLSLLFQLFELFNLADNKCSHQIKLLYKM